MTKKEYMQELSKKLNKLPREEALEALGYYSEYFEDAGVDNEQRIIDQLGAPDKLAKTIIAECAIKGIEEPKKTVKGGLNTIWLVILAICAAPIALPITIAIIAIIFSLTITIIAVAFSIIVSGFACLLAGLACIIIGLIIFIPHPMSGLLCAGMGLTSVGIGLFLMLGGIAISKISFIGIAKIFKKKIKKEEA